MPNTNAVFDYYNKQSQPTRRYYSEKSKAEATPTPVIRKANDNPLAIELTKAQEAAQQGKLYNPYPELINKPQEQSKQTFSADELVKKGINTYLNSEKVDAKDAVGLLETSRMQLEQAKSGKLESYQPSQIEYAISNIDKQIDAYKARGL
jgi:hypothetical protein